MAVVTVSVQFFKDNSEYDIVPCKGAIVGQYTTEGVGNWGKIPCLIESTPEQPLWWQVLTGVAVCYELSMIM